MKRCIDGKNGHLKRGLDSTMAKYLLSMDEILHHLRNPGMIHPQYEFEKLTCSETCKCASCHKLVLCQPVHSKRMHQAVCPAAWNDVVCVGAPLFVCSTPGSSLCLFLRVSVGVGGCVFVFFVFCACVCVRVCLQRQHVCLCVCVYVSVCAYVACPASKGRWYLCWLSAGR